MNNPLHHQRIRDHRRRGVLMPAIAFALLVIGAAVALVLNSLWKDAAVVELQTAAEAAALAAAGQYLSDSLLNPEVDVDLQAELAKNRAARVALDNRSAGQPVRLNLSQDESGDIFFGQRVLDTETGDSVFLQTNLNPDVVEVRASRLRRQGNPIMLFLSGVGRQSTAEAQVVVEAAFDNVIDHFRPTQALPIPALPMAILAADPLGKRGDTWNVNIEQRLGKDEYRFDPVTHQVLAEPDGIPEIALKSVPLNTSPLDANVQLLEMANDLAEEQIARQIIQGLGPQDLTPLQGILPAQSLFELTATANIPTPLQLALESQIGQQRLCLLYHQIEELSVPGWSNILCQGVVAIRILKVIPEENEAVTLIVQPTILTTKTAALARFLPIENTDPWGQPVPETAVFAPNPYVYKVYLSR